MLMDGRDRALIWGLDVRCCELIGGGWWCWGFGGGGIVVCVLILLLVIFSIPIFVMIHYTA